MRMSTQPGLSTSAVAERCASSSAAAERFAFSSAAAEQFASSSADGDSAATERGGADQKRSGPMNLWDSQDVASSKWSFLSHAPSI